MIQKFALDHTYWIAYLSTYIRTFVDVQRRMTPDLETGPDAVARLAKDAYMFAMNEIPNDVLNDPEWPRVLEAVSNILGPQYGQFYVQTPGDVPGYTEPPEEKEDDGDVLVPIQEGSEGINPLPTSEESFIPLVSPDEEKKLLVEILDNLLSQYAAAKKTGDQQRMKTIKQRIQEITILLNE